MIGWTAWEVITIECSVALCLIKMNTITDIRINDWNPQPFPLLNCLDDPRYGIAFIVISQDCDDTGRVNLSFGE